MSHRRLARLKPGKLRVGHLADMWVLYHILTLKSIEIGFKCPRLHTVYMMLGETYFYPPVAGYECSSSGVNSGQHEVPLGTYIRKGIFNSISIESQHEYRTIT
ncbi:MAG: hypothetical protein PVH77_11530 [Phycisphaerales bacterium]|jgi:hypothetical protein